mgnify:CR=1
IAYGEAGWNEQFSEMGSLSLETLPKTSEEEQICIRELEVNSRIDWRRFCVPIIFVS